MFSLADLLKGQESGAEVYLLTCGPGTETYSIYGHSALRVIIPAKNSDVVYNWGVFDFSTPHFAWRFARGRLDYMLGVFPYDSFLQEYRSEKRWVVSQKINLTQDDLGRLFTLISDNLKPENLKYRYDFLYDNCSTRIRDMLEKTLDSALIYPPSEPRIKQMTFRELIGIYQRPYPWLDFGIDLVLGSPVDKKATARDMMFLPIELKNKLSEASIFRDKKMIPLIANPVTILDYTEPVMKENFLFSPFFIFTVLVVLMVIFTSINRKPLPDKILDTGLLTVFSILALLMLFFNFMTDHLETKRNFNIIWLNPLIFMCLASVLANRHGKIWFRLVFFLSVFFLMILLALSQDFNEATFPLAIMLILRSSVRAGFSWNPLSLPYLT